MGKIVEVEGADVGACIGNTGMGPMAEVGEVSVVAVEGVDAWTALARVEVRLLVLGPLQLLNGWMTPPTSEAPTSAGKVVGFSVC